MQHLCHTKSGAVHTMSEEFENGGLALKMHQFSGHLGFVFEENSVREIT